MFILTKNRIETSEIQNIEKTLISKRMVNIKDSLVLNNPKHLNLMKDFDISNYNHIYEIDDYIIKENEKLFSYIKNKDLEHILKILVNTHEDNVFSKEIVTNIIASNNANIDYLNKAENMIKELIQTIYVDNSDNPVSAISKLKQELFERNNLDEIEKLKLNILKRRTTRWTLLKTLKNLGVLSNLLTKSFNFDNIKNVLKNPHYFIYLSEKEYSTIFDNDDKPNYIVSTDLFSNYRYRDLKEFKDGSTVNYKKLKYLYIASNNYILKKVNYSDFLNDEESVIALNNMFNGFKLDNIDETSFNRDFLERVITENHDEIKSTIYNKFMDLVDDNLKDLFKPDEDEINDNNDSVDILSFVSKMYDINDDAI